MGRAVGLVCLSAAARVDPHADGRSLGPRGVLGRDLGGRVNFKTQDGWQGWPTVKPFLSVVDSVLAPKLTGVARPRVKGEARDDLTALMAARERMPCCRLRASRREAIVTARRAGGGREDDGGRRAVVAGRLRGVKLQLGPADSERR